MKKLTRKEGKGVNYQKFNTPFRNSGHGMLENQGEACQAPKWLHHRPQELL